MRKRSRHAYWLWLPLTVLLLSACAASKTPPRKAPQVIDSEAAFGTTPTAAPKVYYTVKEGDNLYSIGLIYDRDYRQLAAQNRIRNPHRIYPGQRIAIPRAEQAAVAAGKAPTRTSRAPAIKGQSPPSRAASLPEKPAVTIPTIVPGAGSKKAPQATSRASPGGWIWPAKGPIILAYGKGHKGINISGKSGQPIRAAADGEVVYSGSGLAGYGRLLILKHSRDYLSAYAHNRKVHVNEGDNVAAGQHISDMGRSGTDRVMLHFELRKRGRPLNPERYLPRR